MLRDLHANDLFCYPTTIHIGDRRHGMGGWDDGRDYSWRDYYTVGRKVRESDVDRALLSFPQDLELLLTACPHLGGKNAFKQYILKEGDIGATLGFLLTLLPNLTSIYITDYGSTSHGSGNCNDVARNIVEAGRSPGRPATQTLSKLTHMSIKHSERGMTSIDRDRDLAFYWHSSTYHLFARFAVNTFTPSIMIGVMPDFVLISRSSISTSHSSIIKALTLILKISRIYANFDIIALIRLIGKVANPHCLASFKA